MALYIVRPWEILIPELVSLRFERVAYILILFTVSGSTGLRWRWNGPTKGLAVFTAALCISAFAAFDPGVAWSAPAGLYVYLTNLLAIVLIISVVRTPYDLVYVIAVAAAVMFAFAGKSLWEYAVNGAGQWSMGVTRLAGINDTFGHPNAVATLLVSTLPWLLFLWRSHLTFTSMWSSRMKRLFIRLLIVAFTVFVISILLTGSRIGVAGLATFGLLSWYRADGKRLKTAFLIGVAIILAGFLLDEEHTQRIRSLWDDSAAIDGGEESKEGRIYAFEAGLRMFQRYPITGVGIGNFGHYRSRHDDGSDLQAHSIPAQLLGETGLLGASAFVYFLWTLYKATRQLNQIAYCNSDGVDRMLSCLGSSMRDSIILLLVHGMANHVGYLFIWTWIAAFLSCAVTMKGNRSFEAFLPNAKEANVL